VTGIRAQILRWIADDFPGWVECSFLDHQGEEHRFREKVPMVSSADLHAGSPFPQPGVIGCTVVRRSIDESGRSVVSVDTDQPWGIESIDGRSRFEVDPEDMVEFDDPSDSRAS
jgi:hypothetical protein